MKVHVSAVSAKLAILSVEIEKRGSSSSLGLALTQTLLSYLK